MTRHGARPAGFTLIELIVVFAILGMALAMLISRTQGPSAGITLRAAANELAAGLRDTRAQAIVANRPTELRLDLPRRTWQAANGPVHALPAAASVSLLTLAGQIQDGERGGIRFEPDGSSSGGRIELAQGNSRIDVGIDWLTGRISVGNAP
jgi:general secretion pathway protein H